MTAFRRKTGDDRRKLYFNSSLPHSHLFVFSSFFPSATVLISLVLLSSLLWTASDAKNITLCNATTISFESGDFVALDHCGSLQQPLILRMMPISSSSSFSTAPCENIRIQLRRVILQELDWNLCAAYFHNISISIVRSTVLWGGVLTLQTNFAIASLQRVTVSVEDSLVNLTHVVGNPFVPRLIRIEGSSAPMFVLRFIDVSLRRTNITAQRIAAGDHTYMLMFTGAQAEVRNLSVTWDDVNLDVRHEDTEGSNATTTFVPFWVSASVGSNVSVHVSRCSLHFFTPRLRQDVLKFESGVEDRWDNVEVLVKDLNLTSNSDELRMLQCGSFTSSDVFSRDYRIWFETIRVSIVVSSILQFIRARNLIYSSLTLQNVVTDISCEVNVGNMQIVAISSFWNSECHIQQANTVVVATPQTAAVSPSLALALLIVDTVQFASFEVRDVNESLQVLTPPSSSGIPMMAVFATTASLLKARSNNDSTFVLSRAQFSAQVGLSNDVAEVIAIVAISVTSSTRSSFLLTDVWVVANVPPTFVSTKINVGSAAALFAAQPNIKPVLKSELRDTVVQLIHCSITASGFFSTFAGGLAYREATVGNCTGFLDRVSVALSPPLPSSSDRMTPFGFVGLISDFTCFLDADRNGSSPSVTFVLQHCTSTTRLDGGGAAALLVATLSSVTTGSCWLDIEVRDVTTVPTPTAAAATSSAACRRPAKSTTFAMDVHSTARFRRSQWTFRGFNHLGQCYVFRSDSGIWADGGVSVLPPPAAPSVMLQGCLYVGGERVSARSLGAPLAHVQTINDVCGFSNTLSASLTQSEELAPPVGARVRDAGLTLASAASGLAVVAGLVTQWGSAVAVQRSLGAITVAACGGEAVLDEPLDVASSPLQLEIGDAHGASARGAILGNLLLMSSACVVGIAVLWCEWRRNQSAQSTAKRTVAYAASLTAMPVAIVVPVAGVLLPPIATASVSLSGSHTASPGDYTWSAVGVLACLVFLGWQFQLLGVTTAAFRASAVSSRCRRRRRLRDGSHRSSRSLVVLLLQSMGSAVARLSSALLRRSWVWKEKSPPPAHLYLHHQNEPQRQKRRRNDRLFLGTYGPLFDAMRKGAHGWSVVELAAAMAAAALSGLLLTNAVACRAVAGVVGAVSAVLAGLALVLRPYDALLDTLQSVVANVLAAITALIVVISDNQDGNDESSSNDPPQAEALLLGLLWCQTAVAVLSLMLTFSSIVSELLESGSTTHRGARILVGLWRQGRRWWIDRRRRREGNELSSMSSSTSTDDDDTPRGSSLRIGLAAAAAGAPKESSSYSAAQKLALERLVGRICREQRQQQQRQQQRRLPNRTPSSLPLVGAPPQQHA